MVYLNNFPTENMSCLYSPFIVSFKKTQQYIYSMQWAGCYIRCAEIVKHDISSYILYICLRYARNRCCLSSRQIDKI